jgi:hypothetical protein
LNRRGAEAPLFHIKPTCRLEPLFHIEPTRR